MKRTPVLIGLAVASVLRVGAASAAEIRGQVLGAGAPIANSTVTLWAASAGAPQDLGHAKSGADGRFALSPSGAAGKDAVLYLVAKGGQPAAAKAAGDNPAIALMTVLGSKPPAKVAINEMTTVASVWTHAQFLDGYVGGGLQMQTDLAIDPAGNVWVMDNWQDINSCYGTPPEGLSTRCGGQGVTIFYGMAKPVRAPQIGPAQAP